MKMQLLTRVLNRVLMVGTLLVAVTCASYVLLYSIGDVGTAIAGEGASQAQIDALRTQLGLDDPVLLQYADWLGGVVTGDLGHSFRSGRPVTDLLTERVSVTASLTGLGLLFSLVISVLLAFCGALRPGKFVDHASRTMSIVGMSVPNFFLAFLLVFVFAVQFGWLPATGYVPPDAGVSEWLRHMILPALAIGLHLAGEQARTLRASLNEEAAAAYMLTAHAKNVPHWYAMVRHAGRNASIPFVTVLGLQVGRLVAGAVMIETVFALPGLGSLVVTAVSTRDLVVVQGVVLLTALIVVSASLIVDASYAWLMPSARRAA